jgi:hypothetical protein
MKLQKKLTDAERIEFAKQIEFFFESAHSHLAKMLGFAFLRGVATGLGVFAGGTIVVALLLWILSGLGQVPFLNDISQSAKDTLEVQK